MGKLVTAGEIAAVLKEPCRVLIARALRVLGPERCVTLVTEALLREHQGGMLLKDGSRKRSLGGVFLELCRQRSTDDERRKIFR